MGNGFSHRKHRAFWKQKYPHKYGYFTELKHFEPDGE
jgi:hypothetical protein